jgi:hypothetical protein
MPRKTHSQATRPKMRQASSVTARHIEAGKRREQLRDEQRRFDQAPQGPDGRSRP